MGDTMRELLHASIQWRHVRTLLDNFKDGTESETPIPHVLLNASIDANRRLYSASLAAEREHGTTPTTPRGGGDG